MKFKFQSFASRLSAYTITFTIVIFTLIMIIFYAYSSKTITDHALTHTHSLLNNMASQINNQLTTVEAAVNNSAWMIEESLSNPDSLIRISRTMVQNNENIIGSSIAFEPNYFSENRKYFMAYSYKDGDSIKCTYLGSKDYDYFCMDWYLIPKLLKENYWSEPYYDEGGGNIIMSTYSHPMYDKNGHVYAIFTADISLTYFTNLIENLKPYDSSYSFMLSRHGYYLTHRRKDRIMNETIFSNAFESKNEVYEFIGREMIAGRSGTAEFDNDGDYSYAFYTSIPNIRWSVCNVCPRDIILSELHTTSRNIILLFVAGVILLFVSTFYSIKKLVSPLEGFTKSARKIASGNFDVRLPEIKSHDEMKQLHDSFLYMQKSLSDYMIELQSTTKAKERIESELTIARTIQMGMIPKIFPPFPERDDIDLHAILTPAKEVGGDLYDFFISNEQLHFVIGDVSGKGIPASLLMAVTRSLFRTISMRETSPQETVTYLNNAISDQNESNMFVTLFVGLLDLKSGLLQFCNAGHNPPVIMYPDGKTEFMHIATNLPVGLMEEFDYVGEEILIKQNTKIFLYTDGITEAENSAKELYSDEQLLKTLETHSKLNVKQMIEVVINSVSEHVKEADQSDDLTALVINYKKL